MISKFLRAAISAFGALSLGAAFTLATPSDAAAGWRPGYRWHAGYWYRGPSWLGHSWGAPVAAVAGGLAVGALAAPAYYAYGPIYYGGCYWQNRPVYDAWGNFAGYAPVQACY